MQTCGGRRLLGGVAPPPPVVSARHSMDRAQRAHIERALGVTTTVLFVASLSYIVLTALYACFCDGATRRRRDEPDGAGAEAAEETKRALDGIPVHVVVIQTPHDGGECAVCLAEYAGGEEVRVLPACGHGFHRECVDRWLLTRAPTCPVCRSAVVARVETPDDDAKEDFGDGGGGRSRVLPAILP
uniref:RING-type E3 ubiquitin transferase n=1 Tax=Leersia perrieri TaxID=77586 RepID=A0A0D9XG26_9ORYZ